MLILKFFIKKSNGSIYVEDEARVDNSGSYKDADYVYLKEGKIPRELIDGEIEEQWLASSKSEEESGLDFRL